MFQNKKGAEKYWLVVGLISLLIVAAILILIITNYGRTAGGAVDRESCKQSVLLKAQAKILGQEIFQGDLNCNTNKINIDTIKLAEIQKSIADEMYFCWDQFARGEADFTNDVTRDASICYICSKITFDQRVNDKFPAGISMRDYLTSEFPPLHNMTYDEFFSNKVGEPFIVESNKLSTNVNNPVLVIFVARKLSKFPTGFTTEEKKEKLKLNLPGVYGQQSIEKLKLWNPYLVAVNMDQATDIGCTELKMT